VIAAPAEPPSRRNAGLSPVEQLNRTVQHFMQDAPACDTCGAITVRNGACYKCLNCGNSMGCS
jgi:ribonucleoside-diphosphate reductase alpha chain